MEWWIRVAGRRGEGGQIYWESRLCGVMFWRGRKKKTGVEVFLFIRFGFLFEWAWVME